MKNKATLIDGMDSVFYLLGRQISAGYILGFMPEGEFCFLPRREDVRHNLYELMKTYLYDTAIQYTQNGYAKGPTFDFLKTYLKTPYADDLWLDYLKKNEACFDGTSEVIVQTFDMYADLLDEGKTKEAEVMRCTVISNAEKILDSTEAELSKMCGIQNADK